MRTIDRTLRFRKDYQREMRGRYRTALETDLLAAITLLALDQPLPCRLADHAFTEEWQGYRDCHIKPDPVMVYRKPDTHRLELARLGTHSELGF